MPLLERKPGFWNNSLYLIAQSKHSRLFDNLNFIIIEFVDQLKREGGGEWRRGEGQCNRQRYMQIYGSSVIRRFLLGRFTPKKLYGLDTNVDEETLLRERNVKTK